MPQEQRNFTHLQSASALTQPPLSSRQTASLHVLTQLEHVLTQRADSACQLSKACAAVYADSANLVLTQHADSAKYVLLHAPTQREHALTQQNLDVD